MVGLVHGGLVGLLILGRLLEQGEGVVPGLLAVEAGGGEVAALPGGLALLGGSVPLCPAAFLGGSVLVPLLRVLEGIGLPHQGGLPQVLPGGSVLGIAPVEIDGPADEQDDGCGDDIAFPEFHRYFLTFLH